MRNKTNDLELIKERALEIRRHIVKTIISNGEGHVGSALSCADLLAVLYMSVLNVDPGNPRWADRDRFILSAGHKCLALYGALIEREFVTRDVLDTYNRLGSLVPGHPDAKKLPGVDFSTGSLGHGLALGCGVALAAKMDRKEYKAYVLMGDGEQGEGSVWEAASFASHKKLDNLVAILDRNRLQINGPTKEVADTDPLEARYAAFGWSVRVIDGHSVESIYEALTSVPFALGKPSMIIADTIKGKGLSFAENDHRYHHWHPHPDGEEAAKALTELGAQG